MHNWKKKELFDMFSKNHTQCTQCGAIKGLQFVQDKDGKCRPRYMYIRGPRKCKQ